MDCRLLNEIQMRLIYAKDFTQHKVGYYEKMVEEHIGTCPVCLAEIEVMSRTNNVNNTI